MTTRALCTYLVCAVSYGALAGCGRRDNPSVLLEPAESHVGILPDRRALGRQSGALQQATDLSRNATEAGAVYQVELMDY